MRTPRRATARLAVAIGVAVVGLLAGCATSLGGTARRADGAGSPATSETFYTTATSPPTSGSKPLVPPVPPSGQQSSSGGPDTSPGPSDTAGAVQWTFTVVRHAERADDGTADPPLTDAGEARADRLADRLEPLAGVAVYASPYRRAQATAKPTSAVWDVPLTTYDPAKDADALLSEVVRDHPSGAILIVGHSDTVPEIVGALCRCPVDAIAEDDFGKLYQVTLDAAGAVIDFQTEDDY